MCKDYAVMRGKVEQTEKLKGVISNQDAQLKAAQEVMDQLRKQAEDSEARLKGIPCCFCHTDYHLYSSHL
ncbi:MAG TPA: hypothetical protein VFM05_04710 [Candidatus Saccharimonadales bacterium]|nr:hypothetical protein [Candidatus Saccharimonadales bacterium]